MKSISALSAAALLSFAPLTSSALGAPQLSSVWQVSSGTNTIYLAGAVPFLRESDLPLPAQFRRAYRASRRLVFEVDPQESKDEERGRQTILMGMFTDGGSIRDQLSDETYEKLGDFLHASGAPRVGMDRLRPWFAAVMITMTEMMKEGMRPDLGVGEIIEGWALKDGREISGLERMEVEIEILAALPEAAHEYMLAEALEDVSDMEELGREFGQFILAWREGDVATLEEIDSEEAGSEWDELMDKKLYRERSAKWLAELEAALRGQEPTMYVVGLAHLLGEGNLRAALQDRGYRVEQLELRKGERKKKRARDKKPKKPALIPVLSP